MPVVKMPDGALVRFPDEMPREQIRDMIASKFPDAARQASQSMQPDGSINTENVVRTMIDSVPVAGPLLSKAGAAIDATLDDTPIGSHQYNGATWDDRYQQALADGQGKCEAFSNEHPYVKGAASIAGGVGGVIPMVAALPEAAGLGLGESFLGRSLISGASGGVLGGADSGVRSDFDPEKMLYGTGVGVAGGAVAPSIGRAIGGSLGWLRSWNATRVAANAVGMSKGGFDYLAQKMGEDGLTADAVRQQLAALGPDAMLMDLSPNMKGTASALANHPGEAQTIIRNALDQRQAGANARVQSGINDALGPVTGPRSINDVVREGQRATGPAYEDSFKQAVPVDTSHIANHLETQSTLLRGPAQSAAKNIRNMLNVNNGNTLDTNPYTLLQTRNAIDGLQKNEVNPQVSRILTETRQMIDESLSRNVPGIKMADAQYEELARQNEGLRLGVKALDSGREALRPEELQQEIADGVNPQGLMVGPSAKAFRMQQAARADIDRQIGTKANDLVALKNIVKGEGDWNRDRLGMLFGQDRANSALDLLDREALFANTKNDVVGNSLTQARAAAQKDLLPAEPGPIGMREAFDISGMKGALRSAGTKTVSQAMKLIQQQAIAKRNAQLAQALTSNKPAINEAMNLVQHMKIGAPQVQKLAEAITLDRASKGGNRAQQLLASF